MEPLEAAVDHIRGMATGHLILRYGDDECPYSRQGTRQIERVERRLEEDLRFAFRDMPGLLFHRQRALGDDGSRRCAAELGLDAARTNADRASAQVSERIGRDLQSGRASGEAPGTPTLFIDGGGHHGCYDAASLLEALAR